MLHEFVLPITSSSFGVQKLIWTLNRLLSVDQWLCLLGVRESMYSDLEQDSSQVGARKETASRTHAPGGGGKIYIYIYIYIYMIPARGPQTSFV